MVRNKTAAVAGIFEKYKITYFTAGYAIDLEIISLDTPTTTHIFLMNLWGESCGIVRRTQIWHPSLAPPSG
jgi:hypothetical protein